MTFELQLCAYTVAHAFVCLQAVTADHGPGGKSLILTITLFLLFVQLIHLSFLSTTSSIISHLSTHHAPSPFPDNLWPHYGNTSACTTVRAHKLKYQTAS